MCQAQLRPQSCRPVRPNRGVNLGGQCGEPSACSSASDDRGKRSPSSVWARARAGWPDIYRASIGGGSRYSACRGGVKDEHMAWELMGSGWRFEQLGLGHATRD